MIRLFVGLSLPEALRLRLAGLAGGVPGARWVAPENLHLTLKFIGEVENGVADDIDLALSAVAGSPFELKVSGVGFFGPPGKARILWAGTEPNTVLDRLQGKVETSLARIGIARQTRNFAPHITLARLKNAPAGRLQSFVADHDGFSGGPVEISSFTLFSSYLAATGAVCTPEAVYPLEEF